MINIDVVTHVEGSIDNNYTLYLTYTPREDYWSSIHVIFKTNDGTWRFEAGFDVFTPKDGRDLTAVNYEFDVLSVEPGTTYGYYPNDATFVDCLLGINVKYGVDLFETVAKRFYGEHAAFIAMLE